MTMEDWAKRLDAFLEFTERDVLQDAGKVSAKWRGHTLKVNSKIPHRAGSFVRERFRPRGQTDRRSGEAG